MDASVLLPAHGDPLPQAEVILSVYIAHRHSRTEQFRQVLLTAGASTPLEIAATVYADEIEPAFYPLAARQVLAHLLWMDRNGLARSEADGRWVAHGASERP